MKKGRKKKFRYKNRNWLYRKFVEEKVSPEKIGDICGVSAKTIVIWINKFRLTKEHRRVENKYNVRTQNRNRAYEYKGGKCSICGYNICTKALVFHHTEPRDKSFNISDGLKLPWDELKRELDKCILVCMNCHQEIHSKD